MEPLVVAIVGGCIYFSGKHLFSKKTSSPSQQYTQQEPNPFQHTDPSRLHLAFTPDIFQEPSKQEQRTIRISEPRVTQSEKKKRKFWQKQQQQAGYFYEGQQEVQNYQDWRDRIKSNRETEEEHHRFRGLEQQEEVKKEGELRDGTHAKNKGNKNNANSSISQQQEGPRTPHSSPRNMNRQQNHNEDRTRTQKLSSTLTLVPVTITMMKILSQRPKGDQKKRQWQKSIQMVRKEAKRSSSALSFNQPCQESPVSPIRKVSQQFRSQSSAQ